MNVGDWIVQKRKDATVYGVLVKPQKKSFQAAVVDDDRGVASLQSIANWFPAPKEIEKSEVPEKMVKKIEKHLDKKGIKLKESKGPLAELTKLIAEDKDSRDYIGLERMLKGVTILDGEGSVYISDFDELDDLVYVGIMHDGSGYTPAGVIVAQDWGSSDAAIQAADELLDEVLSDQFEEAEAEFKQDIMADNPEMDEYDAEQRAYDMAREAKDGRAFVVTKAEAYELFKKDKTVSKHLDLSSDVALDFEVDDAYENIQKMLDGFLDKLYGYDVTIDFDRDTRSGYLWAEMYNLQVDKVGHWVFGIDLDKGEAFVTLTGKNVKGRDVEKRLDFQFKDMKEYMKEMEKLVYKLAK